MRFQICFRFKNPSNSSPFSLNIGATQSSASISTVQEIEADSNSETENIEIDQTEKNYRKDIKKEISGNVAELSKLNKN